MKICRIAGIILFMACSSSRQSTTTTEPNVLSKSQQKDGWQLLFDGKTTAGWHSYNQKTDASAWKAANGELYMEPFNADSSRTSKGGDIVTDEEFENFHFKTDWKVNPKGNSGIIFYAKEDPKYRYSYYTGPEMQVLDNDGHPDAKIVKHRAGDLYDLVTSSPETVNPAGQWNTAEIIANKGKLEFILNGRKVMSTQMWDDNWRNMIANSKFKTMGDFGTFRKGRICIQDHGDKVYFRNIMIKKL
ncbi:MAG TPA: DUF1080 domain-containing protein [Flavitalea sp.]|nr:DUF1080 domain-containing protein [Flavitalea sp.]